MVAAVMASAEDVDADERPVHQGCMAGFLHLFDRPQILSGRRLHQSSSSGSATPSERSMPLDRGPSSPDTTPPAAPRPSLQVPPLDLKDTTASSVGAAPSWRLPRLSLDSRAVVDCRGKYRPREIRTAANAPPSPSADDRRSPSVVARLMGLTALPDSDCGGEAAAPACGGGALRRSASERVPRGADPSRFRFVDPAFFERPSSPQPREREQQHRPSSPAPVDTAAFRRDPAVGSRVGGAQMRRSRFDAREVFPDPAKPTAAVTGGEIALYGEIERRLRKRGIAEPARDLETLKQILEALQLKGLLHHNQHNHSTPPQAPVRTPPPIVVMRPSYRAPSRQLRVDVDSRARRPRSPDSSYHSPARSPASPARRGPQSPRRRPSSPVLSPKQQQPQLQRKPSGGGFDAAAARARIARRAAQNSGIQLLPDDEASTATFSDGGSSSVSSRWDFDPEPAVHQLGDETSRKLERCGKLLSSIHAFTGGAGAGDQQPSPVSVLDSSTFLADEDSPPSSSSGSKRAIDFTVIRSSSSPTTPAPAVVSSDPDDEEEDDEWALGATCPSSSTAAVGHGASCEDPDYAYVAELVRLLLRQRKPSLDPAGAHKLAAQRLRLSDNDATCRHRPMLLCGAVAEAVDRVRGACPWDPAAWLRGADLVGHVWAAVRRAREPVQSAGSEVLLDLNEVTCDAIRRDLVSAERDGAWAAATVQQQQPRRLGPEVADAVLQIERLVFKDLVADTIRELADADRLVPPRRKLVF